MDGVVVCVYVCVCESVGVMLSDESSLRVVSVCVGGGVGVVVDAKLRPSHSSSSCVVSHQAAAMMIIMGSNVNN